MDQADWFRRVSAWLRQYVQVPGGGLLPESERHIRDGLSLILDEGVMTGKEARREALEEFNVIIPDEYFPAENSYSK